MKIHEQILIAAPDGVSAIQFYCDNPSLIKKNFKKIFLKYWQQAMEATANDNDECEELEDEFSPILSMRNNNDGFIVHLAPLSTSAAGGDIVFNDYGIDALADTLKEFENTYSYVPFFGHIGYYWSDIHSGDIVEYTVKSQVLPKGSSDATLTAIVGPILKATLNDEDFWDEFEFSCDLEFYEDLIKSLHKAVQEPAKCRFFVCYFTALK